MLSATFVRTVFISVNIWPGKRRNVSRCSREGVLKHVRFIRKLIMAEWTPGPMRPEGLGKFKKCIRLTGLGPATFRLAA
jgi:hypothetical protein